MEGFFDSPLRFITVIMIAIIVIGGVFAVYSASKNTDHTPKGTLYGHQNTKFTTTFDKEHEERKRLREQRRYELAKAAMPVIAHLVRGDVPDERIAKESFDLADAMLAEMEKGGAEPGGR